LKITQRAQRTLKRWRLPLKKIGDERKMTSPGSVVANVHIILLSW
jgi:hypothetical protein